MVFRACSFLASACRLATLHAYDLCAYAWALFSVQHVTGIADELCMLRALSHVACCCFAGMLRGEWSFPAAKSWGA
jgi:hypothetical protein